MSIQVIRKIRPQWTLMAIAMLSIVLTAGYQTVSAAPNCDADGDTYLKNNPKCGGNDCNDSDASIHPDAAELCGNSIDDNCSGTVDEGCGGGSDLLICQDGPHTNEQCTSDFDCGGVCVGGDTPAASCSSDNQCPPNSGKASNRGRCELYACVIDSSVCTDSDSDSFAIEGGACGAVDCNDENSAVNPDAVEVCGDGIDNNCNNEVDENCTALLPGNLAAAGDSITQAFAANCSCNTNFFCLLCLLDGDMPQYSWFDGTSSSVFSVHDRYLNLDGSIGANKSAAADGSEMRGGSNNFLVQANSIVTQIPVPEHVEVELGGNDLCNRDCVDPANCSKPVFTDDQWRVSVRSGLNVLVGVNGLPDGSTVYLLGVPRVQDLHDAGLVKQQASNVNCEGVWQDYDICTIATQSGNSSFGESLTVRLEGIAERQRRYNEILREEAQAYTANTIGQNPRGIEVITDYVNESTDSVGTFHFSANDIDGGDCFHPNIQGQSTIAGKASQANPDLTSQ